MKSATARRPWSPTAAGLLLPLLVACGEGHETRFPQTTFAPVTEKGQIEIGLFNLTLYLGIGVGLLTFGLLGYIMWKYRYRPGTPEPQQVHGNTTLEIAWTLLPALIVAVIAVPTVKAIFDTQPEPPENALEVHVVGKQWWWEFQYPVNEGRDTVITANEIHVPVGVPVHLKLRTDNVLHSFWVPQMGGKRDLITNRVNHLIFTPTQPGVYMGQCAEFCGDSHALMKMRMIVHASTEGFMDWLQNEASPAVEPVDTLSAVALGRVLTTTGTCAGCHVVRGTNMVGRIGPDLTHFGRRRTLASGILENNAENLAAWIRNSPAIKPGSLMPQLGGNVDNALSEEEISYIVAYLQSLQ
jgi:cytochrome c oxidase subunit II